LRERERHELRVFENRVLRKIIGPKREEVVQVGENNTMWRVMISTTAKIILV